MNACICLHVNVYFVLLGGKVRRGFKNMADSSFHPGGKMRKGKAGDKLTRLLSVTILYPKKCH